MNIRVMYFQVLRHKIGIREEFLVAEGSLTVAGAIDLLAARHEVLGALRDSLLAAINEEWVSPEAPLHEGDTLALMPPVSGG